MISRTEPSRVDMRFLSWFLSAVVFTFYILVLVGCVSTSPSVPNLFLIQLQTNQSHPLQVRVGYYGICASPQFGIELKCLPTYSLDKNQLKNAFIDNNTVTQDDSFATDMGSLLNAAYIFQTRIFSPILAASAALFFISIIAMLGIKRAMKQLVPDPNSNMASMRSILSITMLYAFGLALAAAYSTTQAANALIFTTTVLSGPTPLLEILPGGPVQGLQWAIVGLLVPIQWSVSGMFPRPPPPPDPVYGEMPQPTVPYMVHAVQAPPPPPPPPTVPFVIQQAPPPALPPFPPPPPPQVITPPQPPPAPAPIPMTIMMPPPAPTPAPAPMPLPALAPAPPMVIPHQPGQPMGMPPPQ